MNKHRVETGGRGTGRTTRAMQAAPHGAVYVWCHDNTSYARDLARKLGRTDLHIVGPSDVVRRHAHGAMDIRVDHAFPTCFRENAHYEEAYRMLRALRAEFCV